MVDAKSIHKQLKKLKFGASPWNQAELRELPTILHEHEKISECVNGYYEGGVALLVATDMRVLLIDKKPLNYLNVEDLRFDMINEIDYSHRLVGATIIISTGSKTLKFKSYNQIRLRNLINLVQERMSLIKKEESDKAENQQLHLEEINKQLQMYLLAQHQQLEMQVKGQKESTADVPKPSAKLSDYLFAERLLEKFQAENGSSSPTGIATQPVAPAPTASQPEPIESEPQQSPEISQNELIAAAKHEVFGKTAVSPAVSQTQPSITSSLPSYNDVALTKGIEISPIRIAYSKLPMLLRNRKFGRPLRRAPQQESPLPNTGQAATN